MGRKSRHKIDRLTDAAADAAATDKRFTTGPRRCSTASCWAIAAALVILTFGAYSQVFSHAFLNYDDGQFVYENTHVSQGLTPASISWALTSTEIGWYPLTWLSHELDVTLWGIKPGPHLLTNVVFHALTTCLLFVALALLLSHDVAALLSNAESSDACYAAAFIAALFALHPMHVESVAWVSERKDMLSTLFIVLALLLYARAPQRRLGVALAMAVSLGSKQMYVTFPFVLLLLDYWPMGRLHTLADFKARIAEKLPLFALSIAGSAIAVIGQRNLKAMQTTETLSLASRVSNGLVAYCRYLGKLIVPIDLALPYPLVPIPFAEVVGAGFLLFTITVAAVALRKRAPFLAVGWFWFLGTLVPVIGIVALGAQSMADRYSYFSYIGLFLAIAAAALTLPIPRQVLAAVAALVILVYMGITYHQIGYWRDSETLFTHAIAITPPNAVAEYSLGQTLELTKPDGAIAHLRRSIDLANQATGGKVSAMPNWYSEAHVGLGTALLMRARQESAVPARVTLIRDALHQLDTALSIDPNAPHARNNIAFGRAMLAQEAGGTSVHTEYDAAIELGIALLNRQATTKAIAAFQQAVKLQPRSAAAHVYLALGYLRAQRGHEAANALRAAKDLDAGQANEFITGALHMPPGPGNLDTIIARLAGQ